MSLRAIGVFTFGNAHADDHESNARASLRGRLHARVDAAVNAMTLSPVTRIQELNIENATDELYFPNAHSTHQANQLARPINVRLSITPSMSLLAILKCLRLGVIWDDNNRQVYFTAQDRVSYLKRFWTTGCKLVSADKARNIVF